MRLFTTRARMVCAAIALATIWPATLMTEPQGPVAPIAAAPLAAHTPRRLFISGHSLTDHPFPEHLAAIGANVGYGVEWNMQALYGSAIKDRTMGSGPEAWSGYKAGTDKEGQPINVLAELDDTDAPYDTLIITEQHTLLGNLVWNDSLRYLRDFHERIVTRNPSAQSYLFTAWMNVLDLDDPSSWIAYERATAPVWECVAGQINNTLAAGRRTDRLAIIPAAAALAVLAEEALAGTVPGLEGPNARSILSLIFRDDVHLTQTGTFYVALVSWAVIHRRTIPVSARPPDMRADTAWRLQEIAGRFAAGYPGKPSAMNEDACRAYLADTYVPLYLAYQRDLQWRDYRSPMVWLKWARLRLSWPALFRRRDAGNPLGVSGGDIALL